MDLVIDLHPYQIEKFVSAFPLEEFYCPPEEVIRWRQVAAREAISI